MGIYVYPITSSSGSTTFTGGTVSGATIFSSSLSATTYYSGATELSQIITNLANGVTVNGDNVGIGFSVFSAKTSDTLYFRTLSAGTNINITTGDTISFYLSDNIVLTGITASTITSGNTNIGHLFSHSGHTHPISSINGLQTLIDTKVNRSGDTMTGQLIVPIIEATTVSGATFYSAGTNLGNLFIISGTPTGSGLSLVNTKIGNFIGIKSLIQGANITLIDNGDDITISSSGGGGGGTPIANGLNTFTGTSLGYQTINVSGGSFASIFVSGSTILEGVTATTINSGITNVGELFSHVGHTHQFSTILNTAHTHSFSEITNTAHTHSINDVSNLQSSLDTKVNKSGDTMTGGLITPSLSAITLSGGTIYSGSSNVGNLFSHIGHTHEFSNILNTAHTHSVSDISNLSNLLNTKLDLSGGTMTGGLITPSLSANTLSGGTIYSGSTPLQTIITSLIPLPLFSGTTAGGIKQIYPINNNIANNIYSITFGSNNKTYTQYSTILNGLNNIISTNTVNLYHNAILGGKQNTSYNSKYSLLGNGVQNYINGYYSVILGGSGNRIYNSPDYTFLLGTNNKTESSRSFIFGNTNLITGVTNSSILGGSNNKIHKTNGVDNPYNVVINSLQSIILNSSFSNIASGSGNTISNANFSSIINGQSNKTYSSFSTVVGGKLNTAKTEYSIVLGGSGNTAFGISSIVLGGFNNRNTTLSSSYSTIINGVDNTISTCPAGFGSNKTTKFGTVINGSNNHVMYNYATIINGSNNHGNGLYNLIGNGQYNRTNLSHVPQTATTVLNGINNTAIHNYATIINGKDNNIETTFGFIGNGNFNQIPSQGYYGTILNGRNNNVQGGHFNQILNGFGSRILGTNIRFNSIINGESNQIPNNVTGTTIVGGSFLTASTNNTLLGDLAQFRSLTGGTIQMVIASTSGLLGVQTIPTGGSGGATIDNGINTFTAGTSSFQSVNLTALTINTLSASGNSIVSANLSASTIFSGASNIGSLFSHVGHTHEFSTILNTAHTHSVGDVSNLTNLLNTKLDLSGGTMTGGLSAVTLSAETIFSGSTNLNNLFSPTGHTHYGGIGFTIDAGTSVITTGLKGYVIIPYDATIQSWTVVADISGSIVIDVWKDTFNNYPPLVSDSIAGTEKITLSSQTKNQDVSLSSWTTNINAGDILAFNVDSASTVHRVTVSMSVIKTN